MDKKLKAIYHFENEKSSDGYIIAASDFVEVQSPLDVCNNKQQFALYLNTTDFTISKVRRSWSKDFTFVIPDYVDSDKTSKEWNYFTPLWLLVRKTWKVSLIDEQYILENYNDIARNYSAILHSGMFGYSKQGAVDWLSKQLLQGLLFRNLRIGISIPKLIHLYWLVRYGIHKLNVYNLAHGNLTRNCLFQSKIEDKPVMISIQCQVRPGGFVFDKLYLLISLMLESVSGCTVKKAYEKLQAILNALHHPNLQKEYKAIYSAISYFIVQEICHRRPNILASLLSPRNDLEIYKSQVIKEYFQLVINHTSLDS